MKNLILFMMVILAEPSASASVDIFNDRVLSSIVKIHFSNGHCTGLFVSDEGHLLTANHCLIGTNATFKSAEEIMTSADLEGQLSMSLSNEEHRRKVNFKIVSTGAGPFPASHAQFLSERILSDGPIGNRVDKIVKDTIEKNIGSQADWIIVKVDMTGISHRCLTAASSLIEPLIAVGYPGHKNPNITRVTKEGLGFSTGSVISPHLCDSLTNPLINNARTAKLNSPFFDQTRVLISTGPIESGMSGGPVLNSKGELTAIISANPYLCKRRTSILVPLSGIKKQIDVLNEKLPYLTEPANAIFHCSQKIAR